MDDNLFSCTIFFTKISAHSVCHACVIHLPNQIIVTTERICMCLFLVKKIRAKQVKREVIKKPSLGLRDGSDRPI